MVSTTIADVKGQVIIKSESHLSVLNYNIKFSVTMIRQIVQWLSNVTSSRPFFIPLISDIKRNKREIKNTPKFNNSPVRKIKI